MNNMDESMAAVEQLPSGISRRDMIKASVAAGALVWSAPVLLTGKAAADPGDLCCTEGMAIVVNVPEMGNAVNCGAIQCLDNLGLGFPCNDTIGSCLFAEGLVIQQFGDKVAEIELKPGVTFIAGAVKAGNSCYFTRCDCLATSKTPPATNPACGPVNTCQHHQTQASCNPVSPNRIWVTLPAGPNDSTIVHVDTVVDGQLNQVELALCISDAVSPFC